MTTTYQQCSIDESHSTENLILPELQHHQVGLWTRLTTRPWANPRRIIMEKSIEEPHHVKYANKRNKIVFLRNLIIISLAISGAVMLGLRMFTTIKEATTARISCDCGRSIAEAEAMGCKYDTMAASWLTEACRDDELSAEFDKAGPGPGGKWYYWADANRTRELSILELSHVADIPYGVFYTEWAWHVAHCTYYWRKQWRGVAYLPPESTYGHIVHCEEVILGDQEAIIVSGVGLNSSTNT